MSIKLPHHRQEKDNTCGLACPRMVLAAAGVQVQESELEAQARMDPRGAPLDELERLARRHRLVAEVRQATVDDLRRLLAEGKLPIALIDRSVFDLNAGQRARHSIRDAILHNVIPVQVTDKTVTMEDPRLPGVARRTVRLFRQAYEILGGYCVVGARPEEA
jgi:hypothetical protein